MKYISYRLLGSMIFLIWTMVLVLTTQTVRPTSSEVLLKQHRAAVLYIPNSSTKTLSKNFDSIITYFQAAGVETVVNQEALDRILSQRQLSILYLHPLSIESLENKTLIDVYENGTTIAIFDTPFTSLGKLFNIETEMSDLLPEYYQNETYSTIAVYQKREDGYWVFHDFFKPSDINLIVGIIENNLSTFKSEDPTPVSSSVVNAETYASENAMQLTGGSCIMQPTIDQKVGNWSPFGMQMMGFGWSTSGPDPINGGTQYVMHADSYTPSAIPYYLQAKSQIWNNCGWTHMIHEASGGGYSDDDICNVNVSTNAVCGGATYWGRSIHTIKPTSSQYSTSSLNNIRMYP